MAISYNPIRKAIQEEAKASRTTTSKQQPREAVEAVHRVYDFSSLSASSTVTVPFRPDSWTGITLPVAVVFRADPSSDIEIVFIDGARYIDVPGRQV